MNPMKQLITFCFLIVTVLLNAQDSFTIRGKIEWLSKSHSVIIGSSWGTFTGEIKNDGSFLITGKGIKAGEALIYTDSSGADALWLEPGEYDMECREIHMDGVAGVLFRTPRLTGPKDAELYYGFSQPFYYLNAATAEERKEIRSSFAIKYIDSAFKHCPSSKILPELLRRAGSLLDDQVVKMYFSLLSEEQLAQPGAEQVSNYYKRKDKIAAEKTFVNFSLRTDNDRVFNLNSIKNKKLILIDFWSSDCAPCRRKHQRLVELYKKYSTKGLEIVSISLDTDRKEWIDAIKKDKMTWINVSELKGWNTTIAENYFIKSIPYGFWIDADRKIISTENLSDSEIEKYLEQ
jgi:thiol-disulfide isomerase/thioredoxin